MVASCEGKQNRSEKFNEEVLRLGRVLGMDKVAYRNAESRR